MSTLWTRLRDMMKSGEEPIYIIKHPVKAPTLDRFALRGVGLTRKDKTISKHKRKMIKASRRRNR